MQPLQVLTLVVAGIAFIAATGSLFFTCSTRKTILHGEGDRTQHQHDATTPPGDGDRVAAQRTDLDALRLQHALWIVLAGIAVIFVAFLMVLGQLGDDKANLGTLFGTITAAVDMLVGLIVGHHAGSAGRDRAEERNRQARENRNHKV